MFISIISNLFVIILYIEILFIIYYYMAQFFNTDLSNIGEIPYVGEIENAHQYFNDNYDNARLLCYGGFGRVLKVLNKHTNEKVVAKELLRENLEHEQELAREERRPPRRIVKLLEIRREIDCLLKLRMHESFVQMKDFFYDHQYVYIIEELIDGGDLFDAICKLAKQKLKFHESDARNIIRSLLIGIGYMHSKNIVHRDLKPENILVKSNDRYIICDFGLVIELDDHTQTSERVGTASYMAPEQINGEYGKAVDMWAIGVISYLILCGNYPYHMTRTINGVPVQYDEGIKGKILNEPVQFNNPVWDVAPTAKSFVQSLLQKDPNKRLCAQGALQHQWITQPIIEPDIELIDAIISIRSISQRRKAINVLKHKLLFLSKINIMMSKRREARFPGIPESNNESLLDD